MKQLLSLTHRIAALLFLAGTLAAQAQTTAFTYQGRLTDNGAPANGSYDISIQLFDAASGGTALTITGVYPAVAVSNGLFNITIDVGNKFPGANRWLEIGVCTNNAGLPAVLAPRQQFTSTPYAITAANAGTAAAVSGSIPAAVPAGLDKVTAIAAGVNHTVALKIDGTVAAWGNNTTGQTNVPAGLSNVTAIAAGEQHSVVLKSDGTVVAWGGNGNGQTNVPAGLSGVTAIAAGGYHTVALKGNGTVVAWGDNSSGQTNIPAGLNGVTAIAGVGDFVVALKSDGTVVAWGDNAFGQTNVPAGLSNVTAVAAGQGHTVALKSDGTVVAWGDNRFDQTNVLAGLSNVTAIAAGQYFTLALKSDGTVVAWGLNEAGETSIPAGLSGVIAIAAGGSHSVALVVSITPKMTIQLAGSNVVLSWPNTNTLGFALYGNANLGLSNSWSAVGQSVVSNLGVYSVTLSLTNTNQFFRLKKP